MSEYKQAIDLFTVRRRVLKDETRHTYTQDKNLHNVTVPGVMCGLMYLQKPAVNAYNIGLPNYQIPPLYHIPDPNTIPMGNPTIDVQRFPNRIPMGNHTIESGNKFHKYYEKGFTP